MDKRLMLRLLAPALAALLGAVVGGYITKSITSEDTWTKLVAHSYGEFIAEASWLVSLTTTAEEVSDEQVERVSRAAAALELVASKPVLCRVFWFVVARQENLYDRYMRVVWAMKQDLRGEDIPSDENCDKYWEDREAEGSPEDPVEWGS